MKQSKVIGISGGVGSGKSTALSYLFSKYEAPVIMADSVGNEVKLKGHSAYEPLVELLGEEILNDSGEIDKQKMASKIFGDDELLNKVNSIIHPEVKKSISQTVERLKSSNTPVIFIEAALLIEAGYLPMLDGLWVVKASENTRIQRLMYTRGYSMDKCKSIISKQLLNDEYTKEVNKYIKESGRTGFDYRGFLNDGDINNLYAQIDEAMGDILNG